MSGVGVDSAHESPFLSEEPLARHGRDDLTARLGALEAETPFARGMDTTGGFAVEPEREDSSTEGPCAGIIGHDDRVPLRQAWDIPYRWICQISSRRRRDGKLLLGPAGTGVLISPRFVLTAAHVLRSSKKDERGQWVDTETESVVVTPARDDNAGGSHAVPFGSFDARRWQLSPKYDPHAPDAHKHDFALIELKEPAGAKRSVALNNDMLYFWGSREGGGNTDLMVPAAADLAGRTAYTAGYPADLGKGTRPYSVSGMLSGIDIRGRSEIMNYDADGCPGQSGSPIWVERDGKRQLVGLFTEVATVLDGTTGQPVGNEAVRITQEVFDQISRWLEAAMETPWLNSGKSTEREGPRERFPMDRGNVSDARAGAAGRASDRSPASEALNSDEPGAAAEAPPAASLFEYQIDSERPVGSSTDGVAPFPEPFVSYEQVPAHPVGPAAPPAEVANWLLGVDISAYQTVDDAGFENLKLHDKVFVISKSSQGLVQDGRFLRSAADAAHSDYYAKTRSHGLIRGSYHFLANRRGHHDAVWRGTIEQQANMIKATVPPLLPGDLSPALDLEDEPRTAAHRFPLDEGIFADEQGYHYRTHWPAHAAGQQELLTDVQDFFDRIEKGFGRTPIIYTSVDMWGDADAMANPPEPSPDYPFANYPLWNVYHVRRDDHGVLIPIATLTPPAWSRWTLVQYAEDGGAWWNQAHYAEPGINVAGIDFDAFRGSMFQLRGLADIGRASVALTGQSAYLAFAGLDDHLHFRPAPVAAAGQDLTALLPAAPGNPPQPRRSGDPVLLANATTLFLYFRSGDHLVEAAAPVAALPKWQATEIEEVVNNLPIKPLQDPRAAILGNSRQIVYVGDDQDWHFLILSDAGRRTFGGVLASAGLQPQRYAGMVAAQPSILATGQPSIYATGNVTHLVGRVYQDGLLYHLTFDGAKWTAPQDITALVRQVSPNLYQATYSPCIYESSRGVAVVYRALRGDLWVVELAGNPPVNLMASTGRTGAAAGHPVCFVLHDVPHVIYRGVDSRIHDMWPEAGRWHVQVVCPADADMAAADPAASAGPTTACVAFRGVDDRIHTATFDGRGWKCQTTGT